MNFKIDDVIVQKGGEEVKIGSSIGVIGNICEATNFFNTFIIF